MKKRLGNWPIGLGLLALTAGLVLGWQVNAAALFSEDFEDGNSNGWSKSGGSWSVVADGSKVYKQTSTSSNAFSYTGTSSWGDYTVQAKVKALSFNGTGSMVALCARFQSTGNFYYLGLSGNQLVLGKRSSGQNTALASKSFSGTAGVWYTVKLAVSGSTLTGYVNDTQVLSVSDSTFGAGRVGVYTVNASAVFDEVTVNNSGSEPTSTPSQVKPSPTTTASSSPTATVTATPSVAPTVTPVTSPVTGAYYVAPNGNDSNPGTVAQPFYSLSKAVTVAGAPGSTIYLRGGTYQYSATIALSASGTAAAPIKIWAYPGEKPVLNFSSQAYAAANRGFSLTGNYWYIKGLEICYAGDNGIKVEGNNNIIEQCVLHHNGDSGIQLGFAHATSNPNGTLCAYNQIINCDSYLNFDFDSRGGDADGFACKMHNGKGNVFKGCRAWRNSDDGWDLYETDWAVEIINCWTWHNGDKADFEASYKAKMGTTLSSFSGNGNGFKLGGNGTGGSSKGTHSVKNCVAFDTRFGSKKGFDQNSHKGGVIVHNCTSFGNTYNYMFEDNPDSGVTQEFKNNISAACVGSLAYEFSSASVQVNNSWNLAVTANAADFMSMSEELAKAPRNSDGSLPSNDFAKLVSGSDLIDQGVNVGLSYKGAAPDLGAYERE